MCPTCSCSLHASCPIAFVSHVYRALRAVVLCVSRALCVPVITCLTYLVSHVPHFLGGLILRAIIALVSHVPNCLHASVSQMLYFLRALVPLMPHFFQVFLSQHTLIHLMFLSFRISFFWYFLFFSYLSFFSSLAYGR